METKAEKDKLLEEYKDALKKKECKYFKASLIDGSRECPFGNKCFYRHVDPATGREIDVGPPRRAPAREDGYGEISLTRRLLMLEFLMERDQRAPGLPLEIHQILDLLDATAPGDEDDGSEFDFGFY